MEDGKATPHLLELRESLRTLDHDGDGADDSNAKWLDIFNRSQIESLDGKLHKISKTHLFHASAHNRKGEVAIANRCIEKIEKVRASLRR